MFFARQDTLPPLLEQAISEVDHFAASMDVFHERQVPRADVFRVMRRLLEQGKDLSFQITGIDENDPYLADVTAAVRNAFDDRVPILVARLAPVGRATEWYAPATGTRGAVMIDALAPDPCAMAAWPTVTFNGTIAACCNQDVVDGSVPPHLNLGHASVDTWAAVRERCLSSTLLRGLRVFGPHYLAAEYGSGQSGCDGYCATCHQLSADPSIALQLEPIMASPGMRVVEEEVTKMQQDTLARRYGVGRYAQLITLGDTRQVVQ
jgi:hypothetical protein